MDIFWTLYRNFKDTWWDPSMVKVQWQQFNGDNSNGFNQEVRPFNAGGVVGLFGLGQLGYIGVRHYLKGAARTKEKNTLQGQRPA